MAEPEICRDCGKAVHHGFARCKNPHCGAVREAFLKYQGAIVEKEGICVFSGASTDVMLPNGAYIWADTLLEYIEEGWLSEDLAYTDRFLEMYPHLKDFDAEANERP